MYRRGLVWVYQKALMIQPNMTCNAVSPMLQRGAGYRLPLESAFAPLDVEGGEERKVTASEIIDAINLFYERGISPQCICFGGGYSEPLADVDMMLEVMTALREQRHGVPFVVQTNGLAQSDSGALTKLTGLHEMYRDAPGSDGDSKLSLWVHLAAENPPQYTKVMEPTDTNNGFGQVCGSIVQAVESGIKVYATASEHPDVSAKGVQQLSSSLGCSDCFVRTYHPCTLYDILGVSDQATESEVKAAYLSKAKELHPDVSADDHTAAMAEVTEAYGVLKDAEKRKWYDGGVADLALNTNESDYFRNVVSKTM